MKFIGLRIARALPFVLAATLASCALFGGGPGDIKVSEVAPLVDDVSKRHDGYVGLDESLGPAAAMTLLEESRALRVLVDGSTKYVNVETLEPAATPVMTRYDTYVAEDGALTAQARTSLLRSTKVLRELFVAARE